MTRGFWALAAIVLAAAGASSQAPGTMPPHQPDLGDGRYRNPVIFADYSDPDVIRVGDDFYLVASSFNAVPALPILHSKDLVNWTIVGHAAARLPSPRYDAPQHGMGVWAPSLRHHDGAFWIYFGDPDLGIFMTKARDIRGPWEPLTLVQEARGWIDPCPLWDDDGRMYLVHAWARSRAGFNSILTVRQLSADGRRVLPGDGTKVFDGTVAHPTIEGPKFYKRNGFYYIFAPAGGVANGWQTVLRSKSVYGPYEDRIVLERGSTAINGPHQGAWIETAARESWFVHFQDRGPYGRITHLQPMMWRDDWPVIGEDFDGNGIGEPVTEHAKPRVPAAPRQAPATSDEFSGPALGLQWQWQANPPEHSWSLTARRGHLSILPSVTPGANLWSAPRLLLQKLPAESFTATASVSAALVGPSQSIGLVVMGLDYAVVRLRDAEGWIVELAICRDADKETLETTAATAPGARDMQLRARIEAGTARFSYSRDGKTFTPLGDRFTLREGRWIGAKIGLVASAQRRDSQSGSYAQIDWFRIEK